MENEHATQFEFRAKGRGYVELLARHPGHEDRSIYVLLYARQGRLIGEPPISEKNTAILNEALVPLNEALRGM